MSVVINDNTDEVLDGLAKSIGRSLTRIGLSAEGYAKKACAVDTGLLRNSITFALGGEGVNSPDYTSDDGTENGHYNGVAPDGDNVVYIGTNVEYGAYVEMGTTSTNPQPFLRPAATEHTEVYRNILKDELKG